MKKPKHSYKKTIKNQKKPKETKKNQKKPIPIMAKPL